MEEEKRGRGRPKGGKPKNLSRARGLINELVERKILTVEKWLDEVYQIDGPTAALTLMIDLCEFVMPKMARVEMSGLDGGPIEQRIITDESDQEIINRYIAQRSQKNASDDSGRLTH